MRQFSNTFPRLHRTIPGRFVIGGVFFAVVLGLESQTVINNLSPDQVQEYYRLNTVLTNTSMAPADYAARLTAAAKLLALTNSVLAPKAPMELPQPPLLPAAAWSSMGDGIGYANAQISVWLPLDLTDPRGVTITGPGLEAPNSLRGSIRALAYCEPDDTRRVLIARVKPVLGEIVGDRVVYEDAFFGDGVLASLVYEIKPYSIAQDVVIHGRIPGPDYY